ncbi:hypothetical protein KC19_VG013100 [Ceratodon purpureus]|uniref:RING-type domain-containing protein n=1 Tax=Ceratodon purpureus TaxID=3225 RepID=A0A8T0HKW4_CERPU|nr:hypothetical protein KC19_VG013100 [Ceratodon purpureus]
MDRYVRTSMWPHASTMNTITSSLADQIESNTCPICFELMKSPDFSPILLSPCGHTFCAKCVTRHLSIHEKKSRYGGPVGPAPCPYCRQKISSQTLNLSLQKMITNILSLQQTLEKADADKFGFNDGFLQAQTRCRILQNELQDSTCTKEPPPMANPRILKMGHSFQPSGALSKTSLYSPVFSQCQHLHEDLLETTVSKQRMEKEIAETDDVLVQLRAKEEALEESIRKVSLEHQKVLMDLMDTQNKSSSLKCSRDDVVAKLSLIQASLFALEQERDKYRLLSHDDHLLSEGVR